MSTLEATDQAVALIRQRNVRNKRLASALREIERIALEAPVVGEKERSSLLQKVTSIAGAALVEERSFNAVNKNRLRRVQRLNELN